MRLGEWNLTKSFTLLSNEGPEGSRNNESRELAGGSPLRDGARGGCEVERMREKRKSKIADSLTCPPVYVP